MLEIQSVLIHSGHLIANATRSSWYFNLVVQLFNAIKAQQKATDDLTEKVRPITTNSKDKGTGKSSAMDCVINGLPVAMQGSEGIL